MLELCCFLYHLWFHLTGSLTTLLSSHWPIKCYLASLISINHFTPPSENLSDSLLTKALRSTVRASLNPFLTLPDFSFMHPKFQEPKSSLTLRHVDLDVFPDPASPGRASFPSLWVQILPLFLESTLMAPGPQGVPDTTQKERVVCVCVCVCVYECTHSTPLPSWREWSIPGSPCETHTAQGWR